jgi:hypothetical protein
MEKILLNIDSRQRDYITYSDSTFFKLDYTSDFNSANFKNINYISLVSIEFPNTFYVFHESRFNTFFSVETTYTGGGAPSLHTSKITIPSNNYDINTLVNSINVQLNDAHLNVGTFAGSIINVSAGLNCSVNTNLNIISFNNLSAGYSFTINFNNNNNNYVSLGYLLGFRKLSIIVPIGEQKATAMFNIGGENYIFMRINDYGQNYINSKYPTKVLAKIVLNKSKNELIFNNGNDIIFRTHKFRQPTDIKKLEIELLDYAGNRLNNNGVDYSFTIEMGSIYDEKIYRTSLNQLSMFANTNTTNTTNMTTFNDILSDIFRN